MRQKLIGIPPAAFTFRCALCRPCDNGLHEHVKSRLGSINNFEMKESKVLVLPEKMSTCIASVDGAILIAGSDNGKLWIWDLTCGDLIKVVDIHHRPISRILQTADGERVVTCGEDAMVQVFDLAEYVDSLSTVLILVYWMSRAALFLPFGLIGTNWQSRMVSSPTVLPTPVAL